MVNGEWRETSAAFFEYLNQINEQPFRFLKLQYETVLYVDNTDIIRNDRKKLEKNGIMMKEIQSINYMSEILVLNSKSTYQMPESLIQSIPSWEQAGICHTVGFYQDNEIVQFLTIIIAGDSAYTIAGNIEKSLKKWSGVMNNYNVFIERSILSGAKRAYIGYECCQEKMRRGAIPLVKYLYVPAMKRPSDER